MSSRSAAESDEERPHSMPSISSKKSTLGSDAMAVSKRPRRMRAVSPYHLDWMVAGSATMYAPPAAHIALAVHRARSVLPVPGGP